MTVSAGGVVEVVVVVVTVTKTVVEVEVVSSITELVEISSSVVL
jgi:hypothetical protein